MLPLLPAVGVLAVGTAGGATLAFGVLSALGFTAGGVAAGTSAAVWQASIGNVATGTLFAGLQTTAATGAIWGYGAAVGGVLSGVVAALV